MEDKKKKKEDKKKRETSQKVPEQKIKVPESAKPSSSQPLATPGSVSPSPGPVAPSSPSPGAAGVCAQVPPGGGNNAKQRTAVANGQPSSSSSPSGSQTSQQQRYMSREVPPRFRCQQDHKVLLKRGQPPLSSMLLGGGGGEGGAGGVGGGSGWAAAPSLSSQGGDSPNANTAGGTDSNLGSSSASPPNSSSSSLCVAALSSSSTTTTSTYANSTWGAGSGSQSSSQGCGKVIVDGTDLGDWPSILGGAKSSSDGAGGGGGGGGSQEQDCPGNNNNSSASWSERNIQQKGGAVGGGAGNMDNPSSPRSSPLSSSSSLNECVQSSGSAWGSSSSSQVEAGLGSAAFYNSKVSHLLPGPQESPVGGSSSSSVSGANFNPNVNPSAWPALVQGGTSTTASEGLPLHSSITSASSFSASTTPITTHSLSSVNQTGLHQQHTETAVGEQQQHLGNVGPEMGSGGGARGPNQEGGDERDCASVEGEGSGNLSVSSSSSSAASSSWRSMPPVSADLCAGASQADGWGGGETGAQGQEGNVWGFGSQGDKAGWVRGNDGSSNTPVVSQGAWEGGSSEAEWGGTAGGVSSSNLAIGSGRGGDGSSNSSSSGGSGGIGGSVLHDSASPKFATMTKAWDNQKGMESGDGAVGEWGAGGGGQGGGTGGGAPSSSSGGGSIAGSGGGGSDSGHKQKRASSGNQPSSDQTSNADVALLSMLNRSDLDPRVLSNTGWGQTQIRQNVAWDLDATTGARNRNERSTSSSSAFSSATMNTTTSRGPGYPSNSGSITNDPSAGSHTSSLNSGPVTARDGWDGGASQSTCGPHMPGRKPGAPEEDMESNQGKAAGGWGDHPPENPGKGWGNEEKKWGDHRGGNWRNFGEQGSGWGDGADDTFPLSCIT